MINEQTLIEIENLCKEFGKIPREKDLIKINIITSKYKLSNYIQKQFGISIWQDYFREKGYPLKGDLLLRGKYISVNKLSLNDLNFLVDEFKDRNGYFPVVIDFNNSNNLPCWEYTSNFLQHNNISINEFFDKPDQIHRIRNVRPQVYFYDKYIEKFKSYFIEKGYIGYGDLSNIDLPNANWLIKNCPNKEVKTYNQFIEWCGFKPHINISKEKAIEIIYLMQSELNRPICAEDFKNPQEGELGIRTVRRIWGETHIMQKELGLQITGKHADRYNINELKKSLNDLCDRILLNENRNIITYDEIRNYCNPSDVKTYERYFQDELKCSLRDYLKTIGFDLPKEGNGMNFTFNDGEKVRSQFEFYFSSYLRNNLNLQYNINYIRDVKYKTFTQCSKNSNCDYVINYKGRKIYVEVVGILKPEKKTTFRTDVYNSKSKEKYRHNLVDKENMFINAGLEYYILFTCDLNDEYLSKIFN